MIAFKLETLADAAVQALIEEVLVTPKPALVDRRGNGAHGDLTLPLMISSAQALRPTFAALGRAAAGTPIDASLRAMLGAIGRAGESAMLESTGGVNAHRGAIWAIGLLVCAAAARPSRDPAAIARTASQIASLKDFGNVHHDRNGARARRAYGVGGAVSQAQLGFPHVINGALPALRAARACGRTENDARIEALLTIMSTLDDTCVLHRGGMRALAAAQDGARRVLAEGGIRTPEGRAAFERLDRDLLAYRASPGGAADLLSATIFLDTRACER
jgi:triphosphoribosyl-dephospho-CoA synthase